MMEPATSHRVTLQLNGKLLNQAMIEAEFQQRPLFALGFLLAALTLLGAIGLTIWALFTVQETAATIRAAQAFLAQTMGKAAIMAAMGAPELIELRQLVTYVSQFDIAPFQDKLFWLVQLGGCMPLGVLLVILYRQRKAVPQPAHAITLSFDAEAITVQRAACTMHYPWSAVTRVRFKPPPGKAAGLIVVELEFGYSLTWPSRAFPSRDAFLLTGHHVSAMFMAASIDRAAPGAPPAQQARD